MKLQHTSQQLSFAALLRYLFAFIPLLLLALTVFHSYPVAAQSEEVLAQAAPTTTPEPEVVDLSNPQNFEAVPKAYYLGIPDNYNMDSCEKVTINNEGVDVIKYDLPISECTGNDVSSGNSKLPCTKDWLVAYAETVAVRDFPLLEFFSSAEPTEDNNVMPLCYTDVNWNISSTFNNFVPLNFSNVYPGLLKFEGSKTADVQFPRLGMAQSCAIVDAFDTRKPLYLDIQNFNIKLPKAQVSVPDSDSTNNDSWWVRVIDYIKNLADNIFDQSLEDKEAEQIKTVESILSAAGIKDKKFVCANVPGNPVTKVNISDSLELDPKDSLDSFIVNKDKELIQLDHTELCDLQYRPQKVKDASCHIQGEVFDRSAGTVLADNFRGSGRRFLGIDANFNPIFTCENVICGGTFECDDTYAEAYNKCRELGPVDYADGSPKYILNETGFEKLSIPGANVLLETNVRNDQENSPYGIQYGENVGIKLEVERQIYDLNSADYDYAPDKSEGADYDPDSVNSDLADIISYKKIPYNYYFPPEYEKTFSPVFDGNGKLMPGIEPLKIQYYFPYVGKIPKILERTGVVFTNTNNPETNCLLNPDCRENQGILGVNTEQEQNEAIPGVKGLFNWNSEVSESVIDPQLKFCSELTDDEKGIKDCYLSKNENRSKDPIKEYLCAHNLDINCEYMCIPTNGTKPISEGGNCSEDSIAGKVAWPMDSKGVNYWEPHPGIDFGAGVGTKVYAVADGVVHFVRNDVDYNCNSSAGGNCSVYNGSGYTTIDDLGAWWGGYGNTVVIKHADGVSIYGHLSKGSVTVQEGECVKMNDQIGASGNTGNSSGPHLHFELRKFNCINYLDQNCVYIWNHDTSNLDDSLSSPRVDNPNTIGGTFNASYCIDDGVSGGYDGGDINCLFKIAADTLNAINPRIAPEIIFAIARQETGPICTKTWEAWSTGERTACTGDANQLAFITRNGYNRADIDVRGMTQFTDGTFNSVVSNHTEDMRACIEALGVKNPPEGEAIDPLSSNSEFSRHRVGDTICATAILIAEYGKDIMGGYLTPEEWLQLDGKGAVALRSASSRYYGACIDGYCESTLSHAKDSVASGQFTNLNCSSGSNNTKNL